MCLEEIELRVQKLITIVCSIVNITVVCLFFLIIYFFGGGGGGGGGGVLCDHLMSMGISTLIMNKIFI